MTNLRFAALSAMGNVIYPNRIDVAFADLIYRNRALEGKKS